MHDHRLAILKRAAFTALWLICLPACHVAAAQAAAPGESRYTLELEPFARHGGENAVDLTHANDGTGRVFVSTQSGQVFAFDAEGQTLGVFLDIAQARPDFTRTAGSFNGLMYIAFHPDYARAGARGYGRFYTGHQTQADDTPADFDSGREGAAGDSDVRFVVAEWHVDPADPGRIDPSSYRPVMTINFHTTASNPHALGELAFNPYAKPGEKDYGLLYIAVGDSNNRNESGHTDLAYTQRPDNPFAKLMRIDPIGEGERAYTIPADNPFAIDHVIDGTRGSSPPTEVYAMGLRNAQSYSFAKDLDGQTVIIAFDMGASTAEEVNIVRRGGHYGWDRYEGAGPYTTERVLFASATPPAVQYAHEFPTRVGEEPSGGPAAVVGGFVVADPDDPSFQGQVVFADLPRGTFFHANYHHALTASATGGQSRPYVMNAGLGDRQGTFADVIGADRADVRFGVDEAGRVYLVSKQTDTIYRTNLVHTGRPIKAEPRMAHAHAGNGWPIAILIGIAAAFAVQLLVIVVLARRKGKQHEPRPAEQAEAATPLKRAA